MFLLGGLCFVLLEWIEKSKRSFLMQMLLGMETITALELLSGILLNRVLGWRTGIIAPASGADLLWLQSFVAPSERYGFGV